MFEEAQTFLQSRSGGAVPYYQEMLLRARNLGLGFVMIVQSLSAIAPVIRAACSNVFIFSQRSGADKREAASLLDLSRRETELLGRLAPGECFMRLAPGAGSWPYPFLARVRP